MAKKKKRSKGNTITSSGRTRIICKGKCKGTVDVQYYCKERKAYFCYDDSHLQDMKKYCCSYSWNVRGGVLEGPRDTGEEEGERRSSYSESLDVGTATDCEYKKCKSEDACYWCERKQKWLCGDHYHTSGSCCGYYGSEDDEGSKDDKPLKEVKFANS